MAAVVSCLARIPVSFPFPLGVDSMVIAKILISLRVHGILPSNTRVIAMHIDYANRAESSKEADFVEQWCHELGIEFEKRVIEEVTRGVTDRSEYEKISRDIRYVDVDIDVDVDVYVNVYIDMLTLLCLVHTVILIFISFALIYLLGTVDEYRYGFYKTVLAQYNCKGVIFGHHLGDVQENVISNVMR